MSLARALAWNVEPVARKRTARGRMRPCRTADLAVKRERPNQQPLGGTEYR